MLSGSWPQTSLAEFHEETPFRSTQVILVRSLSSIPRVLGLWVCSSSLTTLRYPILTISCLTALRGLASPSVPGFVVLLAPSLPSSCRSSRSRRVDILVPRVVMGVSMVISLCCVLCRLLPRELLQGSGAGMIVMMFRWFATLFLAPVGSSERHSIELHCLLEWLGMIASDFFVTSTLAPGLQISFVEDVPCLCTQDPVAQCLIHRCELQSRCVFQSALLRLDRLSDFVTLEFQFNWGVHGSLSGFEAKTHLYMWFFWQQLSRSRVP